ncbi:MAG: hypothetical protein II937_14665 [Bacteroidales bacterium]|nr:hypothetical protein [Bacteroidales bacterium]
MIEINELVKTEAASRNIKRYKTQTVFVDVIKPNMIIDLNKYPYLFCSESCDTKIHTKVELISSDNYFAFTKTTLEDADVSQFQFFTSELEIKVSNYGKPGSFIPFRLEFLKIIPETDEQILNSVN